VLSVYAREQIGSFDMSLEDGGWILGSYNPDTNTVFVDSIVRAATPFSTTRVELDLQQKEHLLESGRLVGDIHSHPAFQGERASSSPRDRGSWERLARTVGNGRWVGLILSKPSDQDDWVHPRVSGWVSDGKSTRTATVRFEQGS
jgi:hypothetical protein